MSKAKRKVAAVVSAKSKPKRKAAKPAAKARTSRTAKTKTAAPQRAKQTANRVATKTAAAPQRNVKVSTVRKTAGVDPRVAVAIALALADETASRERTSELAQPLSAWTISGRGQRSAQRAR